MRDTVGNPEQARRHHLAHSGSQSQDLVHLAALRASHIIKLQIAIINTCLNLAKVATPNIRLNCFLS